MPAKCKEIINLMEMLAPSNLASDWDNIGLLIGDEDSEIDSVLVSLDINDEVIDEAISIGADLIITHHPVIFEPFKSINTKHFKEKIIYKTISNGINVYSAHTNLDCASMGINDYLARKLKLQVVTIMDKTYESSQEDGAYGFGRVGYLKPQVSFGDLCSMVKSALGIEILTVVGELGKEISKVAVMSGSGSHFIESAYELECDAYITGDIKYHDACNARDMGLSIIDAGHFETENIYMPYLAEYLKSQFNIKGIDVPVSVSKMNKNPFIKV